MHSIVVRVAAAALGLAFIGQAHAEGEGNGDPFPHRAPARIYQGAAIVADTGSQPYPTITGQSVFSPVATQIAAASGNEAPVQSLNSLPSGFEEGTVTFAQQRSVERWASGHRPEIRVAQNKVGPN